MNCGVWDFWEDYKKGENQLAHDMLRGQVCVKNRSYHLYGS